MHLHQKYNLASMRRKQEGLILMVALIVLVAMTLAGIALVRSVDTSNVIAGNLAFKRGTVQASEIAVNTVRSNFQTGGALFSDEIRNKDNKAQNYSAVQLPVNNPRGIPDVLANKTTFDSQFTAPRITDPNTKEEMRYVIERLCTRDGPSAREFCALADQTSVSGSDNKSILDLASPVLYRVTVRVDGPRNTVSFTQNTFVP
jgi:type IV pilus assembly protein PilX